ncbi:MAG: hypothetical protein LKF71_01520 [Oscillospiraceae bacterium]|nr:hypothetical protein [Oscillospiraceae bacterium]
MQSAEIKEYLGDRNDVGIPQWDIANGGIPALPVAIYSKMADWACTRVM